MSKIAKSATALLLAACMFAAPALYGCADDTPQGGGNSDGPSGNLQDEEWSAPTITGADDVTLPAGTFFDPYSGVSVTDADGSHTQSSLSVSGSVNTSEEGVYNLTYTALDSHGLETKVTRTVTIAGNALLDSEEQTPVYTSQSAYNIAAGCNASASSRGENAALATDGDLGTRWESEHWGEDASADDAYFEVDLGAVLPVEGVKIYWEAAFATAFEVQFSQDGKSYATVAAETDYAPSGNAPVWQYSPENAVNAQYVRINLTERATVYGYSFFEFEVYGKQGTHPPVADYPVLFDAKNSGGENWYTPREEWLLADFGELKTIDYMELAFHNWTTPDRYRIYASADSLAWTEITRNNNDIMVGGVHKSISARYVKIEFGALNFDMNAYRVDRVIFRNGGEGVTPYSVTASSSTAGHAPSVNWNTYWESAYSAVPQTFDLGDIEQIGLVEMRWKGDNGGAGKYYDLQISSDGVNYQTVYRQNHGAEQVQTALVCESARYLRIVDYSNGDTPSTCSSDRYRLEGIVINSQYPDAEKPQYDVTLPLLQQQVYTAGKGSYTGGIMSYPTARLVTNLDESLRGKPVPSNDWWQSLIIGGSGNPLYLNPLVADFTSGGMRLTNPGDGYFSGSYPGNGRQTIDTAAYDISVGYAGMSQNADVRITGYTDYGISAAITDTEGVDKLSVWFSQGAAYAYFIYADPSRVTLSAYNLAAVYDLDGNEILSDAGNSFTGDCIVICARTHSGYKDDKESTGIPVYEDRYYVVNMPGNSVVTRGEDGLFADLGEGNYLSVGAMTSVVERGSLIAPAAAPDRAEAELFHEHGYAFVMNTLCTYEVEDEHNTVTTRYHLDTWLVRDGFSAEPLAAYLPHQYKIALQKDSGYYYTSVRGDCRLFAGNELYTEDNFYGIVPQFVLPENEEFSAEALYAQLNKLYANMGGDKDPALCNLINGDPYWQGKNLHPMAMAVLAADQLGATDLRDGLLEKIRYILADWFTYDDDEPQDAYLYYDEEWGTLYYMHSEFGANVNLADHHFTYGYMTLAAGVLCAYDRQFLADYGPMVELLIRDYMNTSREDDMFPYMRNFDVFAGHGWAGGYADNDSGNNQESAGEALNSWVGAYLYALAAGNEEIKDAAIYGFTTELSAIKQYWFNYDEDSFIESYPYHALGQLYGGANFFGTFFNGEPLYAYGIHLLPGGEYLTSYGLDEGERSVLKDVVEGLRADQVKWGLGEEIYAWQHIYIPIVSIYDADEAARWYGRLGGNVGNDNEQFNVYYFINAMKSLGGRTREVWAENGLSATVYKSGETYVAQCWNPAPQAVTFTFRTEQGKAGSAVIPAHTLAAVNPFADTASVAAPVPCGELEVEDYFSGSGVRMSGGNLISKGGEAKYLVNFGDGAGYMRLELRGGISGVSASVAGAALQFDFRNGAYVSQPFTAQFNGVVNISYSGSLSEIKFTKLQFTPLDISSAVSSASSENGNNGAAGNLTDGNNATRWESVHKSDPQRVEIDLGEVMEIYKIEIDWEAASAAEYEVFFSEDGEHWTSVYALTGGIGARTDAVLPSLHAARYIRIDMKKRSTDYGYSIYELRCYGIG